MFAFPFLSRVIYPIIILTQGKVRGEPVHNGTYSGIHSIVSDDNESDDDSSDEDYVGQVAEEHETDSDDDGDDASNADATPPVECIESGLPSAPLKAHVRTTRRSEGKKPGSLKEAAVRALSFASHASAEALVKVFQSQQSSPQKPGKGQNDGAPYTAANNVAQLNSGCEHDDGGDADSESEELACSSDDDDTIKIDAVPQELRNASNKILSSLDSDLLVRRYTKPANSTTLQRPRARGRSFNFP